MGELSTEEWKKQKKIQRAIFTAKQNLPYEVKLRRQARRAWEFWTEMEYENKNCHVSVGGLDSITLFIWLHSIGIHVTGITVSGIEDQSIQKVHRALGLEIVKSYKSKVTILNELGFPVISKKSRGGSIRYRTRQRTIKRCGMRSSPANAVHRGIMPRTAACSCRRNGYDCSAVMKTRTRVSTMASLSRTLKFRMSVVTG